MGRVLEAHLLARPPMGLAPMGLALVGLASLDPPYIANIPDMKAIDHFLQAVAADEPHGVVGPAVAVGTQCIDWHDSGVFEAASHFRLQQEAGAAGRIVGVAVENLLQCHLAMQLRVEGDEDGAQAALAWGLNTRKRSPS